MTTIAADAFGRSVTDGWGSADTGGAYTLTGTAANFDVAGGIGTIIVPITTAYRAALNSVSQRDIEVVTSLNIAATPTAYGSSYIYVRRSSDDNNYYRLEIAFGTGGGLNIALQYRIGGGSTTTVTGANYTVPSQTTFTGGQWLRARFYCIGASPTTLKARLWAAANSEPGTWTFDVTDSNGPQVAGGMAFFHFGGQASTYNWDDMLATDGVSQVSPALITQAGAGIAPSKMNLKVQV